ncbi:type II toxin-antitoxin system RelE/ParE family toxin [Azospirillum sp. B4]|uniref:type II toxin-antitoxin system RelE/ParE family toxin n=1 Tax=Azospirillum sp. B4 TaxID=95605 RepID=UPI0019016745|nr:type II toxin-antitoxin system RelE/ParE family toxin [Azospirillum sp. B4]
MLVISWRDSARNDLARIIEFIAERSPFAARRMRQVIEDAVLPAAAIHIFFGRVVCQVRERSSPIQIMS